MKTGLIIFLLISLSMNSFAGIVPEAQPDRFGIIIEIQEQATFASLWSIGIWKSEGMTIITKDEPAPIRKEIRDEEVSRFWKSAREVINSFQFEQRDTIQQQWLLIVVLDIGKERFSIQQEVGKSSEESLAIHNLIELCNSYLPKDCQFQ